MEECGICFEPETTNKIIITNCNHAFHLECIRMWIWHSDYIYSCPICRSPMDCTIKKKYLE